MRCSVVVAFAFFAAAPLFAQGDLAERLRSLVGGGGPSGEPPSDVEEILSRDEFEGLSRGPTPEAREDLVEEWRSLPGRAGAGGSGGGPAGRGGSGGGAGDSSGSGGATGGRVDPGTGAGSGTGEPGDPENPTCDEPSCDHSGGG